jgi:hypothetical protein
MSETTVTLGSAKTVTAKTNIVVCGYPKSGTTWLSRLVAELVQCPLQGDFGFSVGVRKEGQERDCDYDCYKSHRTLASLVAELPADRFKIIYVVRDPRDVAISAAHHFRVNLVSARWAANKVMAALNSRLRVPYTVSRNRMVKAVLYGDPSVSHWLGLPWRDHYREFRQSDCLVVKYESLLEDPLAQCGQIISYLGISKSNQGIADAISNQSFEKKKIHFKSQGLASEYAFLRRGSHGYWRSELSRRQKQLFVEAVGEELRALSYPLV